jgi:hypothetical protein
MSEKLDAGDIFPSVTLALTDGQSLTVPDGLDVTYQIILFYRGHW